ncbi:MAG: hypothetical protein ABI947_14500 [Chloroflexota bacterium]
MTQTVYTDSVSIQGSQDTPQLQVKGFSTQTQPLQNWLDNGNAVQAQITGDGRLQVGNNLGGTAPADALIQVNENITLPASTPTSAWHSLGQITSSVSALATPLTWVLHELKLLGTAGVSTLQVAMRSVLTHSNSGTSTSAELRAADVQTINQGGDATHYVGQATGLRGTASNATSAYLAKAVGVEAAITNAVSGNLTQASAFEVVAPVNAGTIGSLYGLRIPDLTQATANYAVYTGQGVVHIGDNMELPVVASTPTANPAANFIKLYTKLNAGLPQLYAKDASGSEFALDSGPVDPGIVGGRCSLTSATPVTTSDVTNATAIKYCQYLSRYIALYDGTNWQKWTIPTGGSELSIAVPSFPYRLYNVYIYGTVGTGLALELDAWDSGGQVSGTITAATNPAFPGAIQITSTAHGLNTGDMVGINGLVGQTAPNGIVWVITKVDANNFTLNGSTGTGTYTSGGTWYKVPTTPTTGQTLQDGVLCKTGTLTRRFLATFMTGATAGQVSDALGARMLSNYYNAVPRKVYLNDGTSTWTTAVNNPVQIRPLRDKAANRLQFVQARAEKPVKAALSMRGSTSVSSSGAILGLVLDSLSAITQANVGNTGIIYMPGTSNIDQTTLTQYEHMPAAGYHFLQAMEQSISTTASCTLYGGQFMVAVGEIYG